MMSENCIFCKIAAGEIPSHKVYEDNDFIAFLDIAPSALGHVLIVPKRHADDLFALDAEAAAKLIPLAQKLAAKVKATTGCDGVNLLQNNGSAAGQSVFHFHMHIIPRFDGDGLLPVWESLAHDAEGFAALAAKMKVSC